MKRITYEWRSHRDAVDAVTPIIEAIGWTRLNDSTTLICRIAKNEQGRIIGFYPLQLFPHAEPLWVASDYRGSGVAEQLAEDMRKFLQDAKCRGFMVVADSVHAQKMCESFGMERVQSPVYVMRDKESRDAESGKKHN